MCVMEPFLSCLQKQEELKTLFALSTSTDLTYQKMIELGRRLPPYPEELKQEEKIVLGCQSILYLHSSLHENVILFLAHSESLISAGLAYLLLYVYNKEAPLAVLKCPPRFLDDLGIPNALSPSRSNGLFALFLRMKQEALKYLVYKDNN